jgi:hypothetical protein
MLFSEIIAVFTTNHLEPINTLYEQNRELLYVKVSGTYRYQWD